MIIKDQLGWSSYENSEKNLNFLKAIPKREIRKNSSLNSEVVSKSAVSPSKIVNSEILVGQKIQKKSSIISAELKSEQSNKSVLNYSDIFNAKR